MILIGNPNVGKSVIFNYLTGKYVTGIQVNTTDATIGNTVTSQAILELPFFARNIVTLLQLQPGVTEGGQVNGGKSDQANITLDGVPLQDPEDQALYFSDFGDFASAVDSVQVQRGVGTSSVGSASYGGSVNFLSVSPGEKPALEAQAGGALYWRTMKGKRPQTTGAACAIRNLPTRPLEFARPSGNRFDFELSSNRGLSMAYPATTTARPSSLASSLQARQRPQPRHAPGKACLLGGLCHALDVLVGTGGLLGRAAHRVGANQDALARQLVVVPDAAQRLQHIPAFRRKVRRHFYELTPAVRQTVGDDGPQLRGHVAREGVAHLDGRAQLGGSLPQQIQHLGLNGDIQGSGGLVRNN